MNNLIKSNHLTTNLVSNGYKVVINSLRTNNSRSYSTFNNLNFNKINNNVQQSRYQYIVGNRYDGLIDTSTTKTNLLNNNNDQIFNNDSLLNNRFISTKRQGYTIFNQQQKQQQQQEKKQEEQQDDEYYNKYNRNSTGGTFPQPLEVKVVPQFSMVKTLVGLLTVCGLAYLYLGLSNPSGTAGGGSGGGGSGIYSILAPRNYSSITKRPTENFDDVIGAEEAKSELQDLVDYLRNPSKYVERNILTPKGILLVGPPGTGKTLLAKALAGEARIPFISINGSEFEEMFVGVGAKRVRELFQEARRVAPCIVFIDEIDSVGGNRAKRVNYHPSEALNQLLVELDGFTGREGVIVLAATNFQETLDPALVRSGRFDRSIQVQLPDIKSRRKIIELYLKNKKSSPLINTHILAQATTGFSGADLFNLVNWAALDTAKHNQPEITMESLENAKENIIMGKERHSVVFTDEARKLCAYHEAGHALVALLTPGAKDVHKATIMPRGQALGMVSMLAREELFQTKKQYLAEMDVAMGGRAAEELILGDDNISQGASSDIQKATSIAKQMVMKLGMSDRVGKIYIDSEKKLSVQQREMVDQEIKSLLDQSYDRAKGLLTKYSKEHHMLAQALIEYETLSLDEIKSIVEHKSLPKSKKNRLTLVKEREEKEKKRQEESKKLKQQSLNTQNTTTQNSNQGGNRSGSNNNRDIPRASGIWFPGQQPTNSPQQPPNQSNQQSSSSPQIPPFPTTNNNNNNNNNNIVLRNQPQQQSNNSKNIIVVDENNQNQTTSIPVNSKHQQHTDK